LIEEIEVSVVRRRILVLAGLGSADYVTLTSPSESHIGHLATGH